MNEYGSLSFNKSLAYWSCRKLIDDGNYEAASACLKCLGLWFGKKEVSVWLEPLLVQLQEKLDGQIFLF